MSDAVEKHLDKAFASLDDVPVRELEATAEALERRKDGLRDFASIFRNVADAREGGWGTDLPPLPPRAGRLPRRRGVRRADRGAPAPFWEHVREALKIARNERGGT